MQFKTQRSRYKFARRGVSFVEFVGCTVAMLGGLALGGMYLGIDLVQLATTVLIKAEIVKPATANTTEANTKITAESTAEIAETAPLPAPTTTEPAPLATETAEEGPTPKNSEQQFPEANAEDTLETPAAETLLGVALKEPTDLERRAATRKYWDLLTSSMVNEAQGRTMGLEQGWELYDFLAHRKSGHEKVLDTLSNFDPFGVDERLLGHGKQVISWHTSALKLFDRAINLLTDSPASGMVGPLAQSWQSASTQLKMEESLMVDKHNSLATYLDHQYPAESPFKPAFAQ